MDVLVAAAAAVAPITPVGGVAADGGVEPSQRLTTEERWSIIIWKKDGRRTTWIARKVGVTRNTVQAVWNRYRLTGSPDSGARSGRPHCTDEATDTSIAFTAYVDKFTTPRRIRRKLELDDVSPRTIDRRLQQAGLYGRLVRIILVGADV